MTLRDERIKLRAAALDRASTACLTVGILAPGAAAFYTASVPVALLAAGWAVWLIPVIALHLWATRYLKGLTT